MTEPHAPPPHAIIMQMLDGMCVSRGLSVVADLGIADLLKDGPRSVNALAEAAGAHPDRLYRVMRMLAAVGVFAEQPGRAFANTPLSDNLRTDAQASTRHIARWFGDGLRWKNWIELGHVVRTGETGMQKLFPGRPIFEVLAEHPESQATFQQAMTAFTNTEAHAICECYDFGGLGRIVDVGGGYGALALAIHRRAPDAKLTVLDLPHVIAQAQKVIAAAGAAGAVSTAAGSFFEGVPGPADAYVMKHIIHDWDDDDCVRILSHCREGLAAGGRVLVLEMVVEDGPAGIPAKFLDIEMLVIPGGRERTEAELAALFERAGLRLSRIVRTFAPVCVVEAIAR